ncbi:hypothetical protein Hs30E_15000 [Lactococcus hodotermopsidis]|uniref:Glycosyl transferase n=1 Tax=Pseudolactococcus hodotermopsidis TaxID=2709157 RepID=A0A6A0BBX8_9LACT|nr:hypothetical protein Hs30E_15000 [Lactococcus hodotermopsidis]
MSDMQKIATYYGQKVVYVKIDENEFDYLKDANVVLERFPVQTYYSFLARKYLPETVERAMYFDFDVIFLDTIEAVYFQAFEGNYFIGVKEVYPKAVADLTEEELRLGKLVNGGTIIMNIAELRKNKVDSNYFKPFVDRLKQLPTVNFHGEALTFYSDQGLLAYVFRDKVKVMSEGQIFNNFSKLQPTGQEVIVHFYGQPKYHNSEISAIFSNYETRWLYTFHRYKLKAQIILGKVDALAVFAYFDQNLTKAIQYSDFSLMENYSIAFPWRRVPSDEMFSFELTHEE